MQSGDASPTLRYLGPGDLEVQLATLIDVTTDESLPIGHLGKNRLSVNLRATPPLRVHFVLIRYTATAAAYPDPQTYVASDLDLRLINSWLARAYPIAGVSSTNVIVDSNYTVPFDCNKTKWVTHLVRDLDRRISGQIGRKECVHFTIDHQLS